MVKDHYPQAQGMLWSVSQWTREDMVEPKTIGKPSKDIPRIFQGILFGNLTLPCTYKHMHFGDL